MSDGYSIGDRLDATVGDALRAKATVTEPDPAPEEPTACDIEIIERIRPDKAGLGSGIIVPNEIRINGHPVLAAGDKPVIVHEIDLTNRDSVRVTLTVFARRVVIGEEVRG